MAVIEYQQITSLDQVDFDRLFYACLDKLEPSYQFPIHYDVTQKRNMAFEAIQNMIDGNSFHRKENETLLIHKIICDGVDVALIAGYIEADSTTFRNHWFLVAPAANGSRSWLYSSEYQQALKDYYASKSIISFRNNMKVDTPIYNHVLNKQAANNYAIEQDTVVDIPEHNAMSCIINVP